MREGPAMKQVMPVLAATAEVAPVGGRVDEVRLRRAFDDNFAFVWRYLRRMGMSEADADDAAQQVFLVLSRRLREVEEGKERAFLCGTAVRVVSDHRRTLRRRPDRPEPFDEPTDDCPAPDAVADRKRARALLDDALRQMDDTLRSVFVLYELEEMTTAEIAELLSLPSGTVASRLRRARESFRAILTRMRARGDLPPRGAGDGAGPSNRGPDDGEDA
jgi:RNA polymerase sigma-70 factor, ECF subfamily